MIPTMSGGGGDDRRGIERSASGDARGMSVRIGASVSEKANEIANERRGDTPPALLNPAVHLRVTAPMTAVVAPHDFDGVATAMTAHWAGSPQRNSAKATV